MQQKRLTKTNESRTNSWVETFGRNEEINDPYKKDVYMIAPEPNTSKGRQPSRKSSCQA